MELEAHEIRCVQSFGEPFREVHLYLDKYYPDYRNEAHRILLHHSLGVSLILREHGIRASWAAEQHIRDDMREVLDGPVAVASSLLSLNLGLEVFQRLDKELVRLFGHQFFCNETSL